jgi:hypothetical protein
VVVGGWGGLAHTHGGKSPFPWGEHVLYLSSVLLMGIWAVSISDIMKNAAINIVVQVFVNTPMHFFVGYIPKEKNCYLKYI